MAADPGEDESGLPDRRPSGSLSLWQIFEIGGEFGDYPMTYDTAAWPRTAGEADDMAWSAGRFALRGSPMLRPEQIWTTMHRAFLGYGPHVTVRADAQHLPVEAITTVSVRFGHAKLWTHIQLKHVQMFVRQSLGMPVEDWPLVLANIQHVWKRSPNYSGHVPITRLEFEFTSDSFQDLMQQIYDAYIPVFEQATEGWAFVLDRVDQRSYPPQ